MEESKEREEAVLTVESLGPEDTFQTGLSLGRQAGKGEVYCLYGDLGAGKTLFTQGFAQGLGIREPVVSPTFTIIQEYGDGRLPLYHFDVYRIGDVEEMEEIGYEEYFYGSGVCLIEWAGLIEELLPEDRVAVRIEKDLSKGLDYRRITMAGAVRAEHALKPVNDKPPAGGGRRG